MADGTPFRLAACFYTGDMARVFRLGEALEFGMVGLNIRALDHEVSTFGGTKASGLGRAPPARQIGQPPFIGVPRDPHTVRDRGDADEIQRAPHPPGAQCCYRAGCRPATSCCPRRSGHWSSVHAGTTGAGLSAGSCAGPGPPEKCQ
ncbi:aldehyde dehydrogenase family protein [Pseudotabrizicola sediminis]|uniref:aldehyde dehydrogenase family protein n=1 Tax=Pseudotabrizicola sediminis TaxID=2486418 RepID=UPI001FD8C323|nr:aldehyde dehydrogenase family protein [Pseudotabrizicola sediminis]